MAAFYTHLQPKHGKQVLSTGERLDPFTPPLPRHDPAQAVIKLHNPEPIETLFPPDPNLDGVPIGYRRTYPRS
jgi:hypothetical protein